MTEETSKLESNLPAAVKRAKRVYKKRTKKVEPVVVDESAPLLNQNTFYLIGFLEDGNQEYSEELTQLLQTISRSVVNVRLPVRYLDSFTRTQTGIKMFNPPASTTPTIIKMRDSYTDNLINAVDRVFGFGDKLTLYGVLVKRTRNDHICHVQILHNVTFKSMVLDNGMQFDKNTLQYYDVACSYSRLYEATTNDVPDIAAYVKERFNII